MVVSGADGAAPMAIESVKLARQMTAPVAAPRRVHLLFVLLVGIAPHSLCNLPDGM
jgi:hypothetical protein